MARQRLKQRKDGRYVCRYKDQVFLARTEKEALEARQRYKRQLQEGMPADASKMTVRAYAAKWLPVHKHGVSDKCYNDYVKQLNALLDVVGDRCLQDVRPSDIQQVWMHYADYSASTIKRSRQLFYALFDTAQDDGYIRTNPMKSKHAAPPKGTEGTHRALTDGEIALIRNNAEHHFHPAVMVMLFAGLRRGEALALNIDRDVDFVAHTITVREAVRFDSNQPIVSDPKTEAGRRTVPMVAELEAVLSGRHGLVAQSRTGAMMSQAAFKSAWQGYFRAIEYKLNGAKLRRANREDWQEINIRPHDLRHTYCTMLRDAGIDMKLAMRWMGHADEKMILRIYDHVTDYRTRLAIDSFQAMLANRRVQEANGVQNGVQPEKQGPKSQ